MTRPRLALARIAVVAALAAAAPSARSQGFAPGEETVFSVSYLNVPTGEGRILVGNPEGSIWPVILQARTSGAASLLDIREHLVSYWDAPRRLSRGSDLQAYEVGDFHKDSARFDATGRQVTVVEQRRGRAAKQKILAVPEGALDLSGAFVWLRLQQLEVGRQYQVPIVSGTSQFTMVADVMAREVVRTPAGEFPSLRSPCAPGSTASSPRAATPSCGSPSRDGHHLVRAAAEFAVGSIVAELKSYHPGGQVASAD